MQQIFEISTATSNLLQVGCRICCKRTLGFTVEHTNGHRKMRACHGCKKLREHSISLIVNKYATCIICRLNHFQHKRVAI